MFNSTAEFEEKLLYYLRHESERLAIVRSARRLMVDRHMWRHRANELVRHIEQALQLRRRGGASGPPVTAAGSRATGAVAEGEATASANTAEAASRGVAIAPERTHGARPRVRTHFVY